MDSIISEIKIVEGFIEHHLGLTMILVAWASIIFQRMMGVKIRLPGYFFFLYGIGALVLSYSMWKKNENRTVVILEALIGVASILLHFL